MQTDPFEEINKKLEDIINTLTGLAAIPGSMVSLKEDINQIKADMQVVKATLAEQAKQQQIQLDEIKQTVDKK